MYNRRGKCLFYREWNRPLNTLADDPLEERKLMFGFLFSLKDLASKLSPSKGEMLHTVRTDAFSLHHFQSLSGLILILNTDADVPDQFASLQYIYSQLYVDCIARNPLYQLKPDEAFQCPLFAKRLDEYLYGLPAVMK